jgi:hypothetical protein
MPLHELFRRVRTVLAGRPREAAAAPVPMVDAAEYDASQALLSETRGRLAVTEAEREATRTALIEARRRLAVADQRLAILESSNRTAVRAVRRFLQDREQRVAEREAVELRLSIAVGERSIAVGDRQRTMILNEQLLSALRDSDDARQRLEDENRRLRREWAERTAPAARTDGPDRGTTSALV